jgi:hypothetical protein
MQNKRLIRTVLLTAVWTYAAATWASISHHLFGLPDLVLPAALIAVLTAAVLSSKPRLRAWWGQRATLPNRAPLIK